MQFIKFIIEIVNFSDKMHFLQFWFSIQFSLHFIEIENLMNMRKIVHSFFIAFCNADEVN